jgi:hypothetical protein
MKKDISKLAYDKFMTLRLPEIRVSLKNGKTITGTLIGFYKGNGHKNEPFITKWHILKSKDSTTLGSDVFGNRIGGLINHEEIARIYFREDKSTIHFT